MAGPYFITCENPACRRRKQVRSPYESRTLRFCSQRCAGVITGGVLRLTRERRRELGFQAGARNRAQAMKRLAGLSPIEIWRRGYGAGWKSGVRYVRRCQEISA